MSDAAEVITISFGGKTFRCSRRTAAHLAFTAERLEAEHPSAQIQVLQGSYNTGVEASAGTHDLDAVLDVAVVNMSWWAAQRFLRECGWAAWVREPPKFSWHIHMVSLGYPGQVGVYVPGQVADYYAHRSGLAGHAADPSWHPADISKTVFDYAAWLKELEAKMPLNDEDLKAIEKLLDERIAAALDTIKVDSANGKQRVSLRRRLAAEWTKN